MAAVTRTIPILPHDLLPSSGAGRCRALRGKGRFLEWRLLTTARLLIAFLLAILAGLPLV